MNDETAKLELYRPVFRQLFEKHTANVALLNIEGTIVEINPAWRAFEVQNGLATSYNCIGKNYLQICEQAADRDDPEAYTAYLGLLEVMRARRPKFTMTYPCHSPKERRWYRMWVEPQMPEVPAIVIAHYLCATKPIVDSAASSETWLGSNGHSNIGMCHHLSRIDRRIFWVNA